MREKAKSQIKISEKVKKKPIMILF